MANQITNQDDVIDSRDVISRIEELQGELEFDTDDVSDVRRMLGIDPDTVNELADLLLLADEAAPYAPDWLHGATLVRESYFVKYAQQMADDIGATDKSQAWPNNCIDWEQAAQELQQDYTSVELGGTTYWVR